MTSASTGLHTGVAKDRCHVVIPWLVFLAILVWPAVSTAAILNPGFESYRDVTPYPDSVPQGWFLRVTNSVLFGSQVTDFMWKTEGDYSAGLYSGYGMSFTEGAYQGIYQWVNLTDIDIIAFDARLAVYAASTPFDYFEASFCVDDVPLWRATAGGIYTDQWVDVSNLSGLHRLELRLTAIAAGRFYAAYWAQWDNLHVLDKPAAESLVDAFIDVDSGTLNLSSNGKWITCYITLPSGYDVADIDGATVTLEGINAYMGSEGWATPEANENNIVDHDGDGILERMVKFDRAVVQEVLTAGNVSVTVSGKLGETTMFQGTGLIRGVSKGNGK